MPSTIQPPTSVVLVVPFLRFSPFFRFFWLPPSSLCSKIGFPEGPLRELTEGKAPFKPTSSPPSICVHSASTAPGRASFLPVVCSYAELRARTVPCPLFSRFSLAGIRSPGVRPSRGASPSFLIPPSASCRMPSLPLFARVFQDP